jgi:transposase
VKIKPLGEAKADEARKSTPLDALGNPTSFCLTPGQAADLEGSDVVLPALEAKTILADKGYDADEWVIDPLLEAGKEIVIPPRKNRTEQRDYDKALYKARPLIENFFCHPK